MNTIMYDHEIAYCKKVIASGATGDALKHVQERLKKAEAGKKAAERKTAKKK